MDIASMQWIPDMAILEALDYNVVSLSPESLSSCTTSEIYEEQSIGVKSSHNISFEKPSKLIKISSSSSSNNEQLISPNYTSSPSPTSSQFLSFDSSNSSPPRIRDPMSKELHFKAKTKIVNSSKQSYELKERNGSKKRVICDSSISKDHVIAERRRREKLSERLIALTALIPGLKKMDKASVLGEAAEYVKHLQESVKNLEDRLQQRDNMKSVILLQKSVLSSDHIDDDSNLETLSEDVTLLPEIEARIAGKEVLFRIHCEKKLGLIGKILNELDKLQLCVTCSNSMPFGNRDLVMTLTAEMRANFNISTQDLVSRLRRVL